MAPVECRSFSQESKDGEIIAIIPNSGRKLLNSLEPALISIFVSNDGNRALVSINDQINNLKAFKIDVDDNKVLLDNLSENIEFNNSEQLVITTQELTKAIVFTHSQEETGKVLMRLAKHVKADEK